MKFHYGWSRLGRRREEMRAACDWQLEQAIEWIKEYPMKAGRARMIADFKQAMRPQEDNS